MRVGSSAPCAMPTAGAPGMRSVAPNAWMKRLRGAQRPLRLVAGEVLEAEDRVQAVSREPVGDAAVQRDGLVEEPLQALRQLARLLRVERAALRGEARQAHREHDARLQHAIVGGDGLRASRREPDSELVLGLGARQRVQRAARAGAALLHELAIQRLGRGIRCEVELAAQHGAAELVLAQRLRVAAGARVTGHQLAVRALRRAARS